MCSHSNILCTKGHKADLRVPVNMDACHKYSINELTRAENLMIYITYTGTHRCIVYCMTHGS